MQELKEIGNYEILLQLKPERNSRTFKVKHKYTDEVLALKLVFADTPDLVDKLEKIYRKLAHGLTKIQNPHITNFKEYFVTTFENEKCFALVSEFFPGKELEKFILDKGDSLSFVQLKQLFLNTCGAVQSAHEVHQVDEHGMESIGFPHGDISPWNILINDELDSKLLDFKLSNRFTDSDSKLSNDRYQDIVPEQRGSNIISKGTDIFQLGYLLNFLFVGNRDYQNWKLDEKSAVQIAEGLNPRFSKKERQQIAEVIHSSTRPLPEDRSKEVAAIVSSFQAKKKEGKSDTRISFRKYQLAALLALAIIPFVYFFIGSPSDPSTVASNSNPTSISEQGETHRGMTVKATPESEANVKVGEYHGLFIGNNAYDHLAKLSRPIADVAKMQDILSANYGFKKENMITVHDASRDDIYHGLEAISKQVGKDDNLLIFYAGHGQLDGNTGYWIPVEGKEHSRRDWISNAELKKFIKGILAQNVLLISDACFGGSILRDINSFKDGGIRMSKKKSRIALTSGSLESVPDQSVFIDQVFWYLEHNEDEMVYTANIYSGIREAVEANTTTDPSYGPIRDVGHQGGDFFFKRMNKTEENLP